MSRRSRTLFEFDNPEPIQGRLFVNPNVESRPDGLRFFPPILRDHEGFKSVLEQAVHQAMTGLDLEFSTKTKRPTILGIASKERCAAVPWTDELARYVVGRSQILSGHYVTDADRVVLDTRLGIKTPLKKWSDSGIRHYLCNQDFCAAPGKDEDDDDQNALGLMNLWAMASLTTSLPQWKECRASACLGPCPRHDPFGYCAVDSWAGLHGDYYYQDVMTKRGIPNKLYEELQVLSTYCAKMQERGVTVDRMVVHRLEEQIKSKKAELFPYEQRGKKKIFASTAGDSKPGAVVEEFGSDDKPLGAFNPASGEQIIEYFSRYGIALLGKGNKPATDKDAVRKTLEHELRKHDIAFEVDEKSGVLSITEEDLDIPEPLENLYRLDEWKNAGKGLSSWFADKYITIDRHGDYFEVPDLVTGKTLKVARYGIAHPRFIVTGTSTGRLASASPNFQNIPKLGFGVEVRKAIVPRKGMKLVGADKAQLELRICLFYAGVTTPIGGDAFAWLVQNSNGAFKEAAEMKGCSERDIAKSIAHAFDYLEGLAVLSDYDLRSDRRQKEIKEGALLVFDGKNGRANWQYRGGYVCFTGANLAQRLFKNKSNESRKKALAIQELYSNGFPAIRKWHMELSRQIERFGYIQSHTGRYLELYGTAEDDLKLAAAFLGQGGGADEVQEGMLRFAYLDQIALLQVHDELRFEVPEDYTDDECIKYMRTFDEPSTRFGNLRFPIEISVGPTLYKKDQRVIQKPI